MNFSGKICNLYEIPYDEFIWNFMRIVRSNFIWNLLSSDNMEFHYISACWTNQFYWILRGKMMHGYRRIIHFGFEYGGLPVIVMGDPVMGENQWQTHHTAWVHSLRRSDAIWWQWSWTTLVQVMACLTTPSHYLEQSWLITPKVE